jgi:acylphosphatase
VRRLRSQQSDILTIGAVNERRRIIYAGNVQGVGFRWTALRALKDLPISGYVRNLTDGSVELVMEGSPADADVAAERIRAAMAGYIRTETQQASPATGEFDGFGVRR